MYNFHFYTSDDVYVQFVLLPGITVARGFRSAVPVASCISLMS